MHFSKRIPVVKRRISVQIWEVFQERKQDEVCIRQANVYDSATIICAKAFITYITVTVPASNVLANDSSPPPRGAGAQRGPWPPHS